jgi:hypothetical protein
VGVRWASAQVVVPLPSRAAQWHYGPSQPVALHSVWVRGKGGSSHIPSFRPVECLCHIMVSFSMSSEEKQLVACSRRSLLVQVMKLMLKALPLRQHMAFRNGQVRIIGPFDKAKVGSCLMRLPLANASTRGHRESGGYRLAYIVKFQWIYLRIILQKVAGESLVFEERRRGDGQLQPSTGSFSHHDQESHYHGQE